MTAPAATTSSTAATRCLGERNGQAHNRRYTAARPRCVPRFSSRTAIGNLQTPGRPVDDVHRLTGCVSARRSSETCRLRAAADDAGGTTTILLHPVPMDSATTGLVSTTRLVCRTGGSGSLRAALLAGTRRPPVPVARTEPLGGRGDRGSRFGSSAPTARGPAPSSSDPLPICSQKSPLLSNRWTALEAGRCSAVRSAPGRLPTAVRPSAASGAPVCRQREQGDQRGQQDLTSGGTRRWG